MDRKKVKIGYKLGGSFEDYCQNGDIGFEILFPHIYISYEEAEKNNSCISAFMMKKKDNEVVIILCENNIPVETIHWNEWRKYKCNHIKEECKGLNFSNVNIDYEPYSEKFEKIFDMYCKGKTYDKWPMQCLSYWIEPVIIINNDNLI